MAAECQLNSWWGDSPHMFLPKEKSSKRVLRELEGFDGRGVFDAFLEGTESNECADLHAGISSNHAY